MSDEASDDLRRQFERTVEEGEERLGRDLRTLLATGAVGGIDVGIGVFALLAVKDNSHNEVLAALFFSIGFIALTLAKSELFTEDFLVPISTLAAGRSSVARLLRLWGGTMVMNLVGGWVIMAVVVGASPNLRATAIETATHYPDIGIGWTSFAAALLGGTVITLMTWMQHRTESLGVKLVAAVAGAFLLAIGPLNHAIVVSLVMFAGLQFGAPFGYLDWLGVLGWATLGNMVGGIGLVTVLRLLQVGPEEIKRK